MDENEDLYDDIFDQNNENPYAEADIDDLYGNIHNPEVTETALDKVKGLTSENDKYKTQNTQLKSQITILNTINLELKTRNTHLEKNIKDLIETSRVEINRKNEQVKNLRAELDNVLFKRAARNINKREFEDLLKKYRPKEEPYSKLPTKPKLVVKKVEAVVGSPDLNSGNRQFVRKRKRVSLENKNDNKKARIENKENVVDPKPAVTDNVVNPKPGVPAVVPKGLDGNSNPTKSEEKVETKIILGSTKPTPSQTVSKPETFLKPTARPGHPISKPKLDNLDIGLISNYVQDKPRKSKKQVLETRKELDPEPAKPDLLANNVKPKADASVAEEKPVSKPLEPTKKPTVATNVSAPKPVDGNKTSSKQKPAVQVSLVPEVPTTVKTKPNRVYVSFDKLARKRLSKPSDPNSKPNTITKQVVSKDVQPVVDVKRQSLEASQDFSVKIASDSKEINLPIKLFNITAVSKEPKTPISKEAKISDCQQPKTPVLKETKNEISQAHRTTVSHEHKTPVPKKMKPTDSLEPKTRKESKTSANKEEKSPVLKEIDAKVSNSTPISSTVEEKPAVISTSTKLMKVPLDSENNSSAVPESDNEASTSSQLKSPISRSNPTKAPQEWALGHQLFDIFEEKPKVKPRSNSKTKNDKAPEKKVVNKVTVDKAKNDDKAVTKKVQEGEEVSNNTTDVKDLEISPEKYKSTRWNCDHHKMGFRTRDDLRLHRSKGSCFKKRNPSEDTPKKMIPSEDTPKKRIPSGDTPKRRIPSGDQKDFGGDNSKNQEEKKTLKTKDKIPKDGKRKCTKTPVEVEESGIIITPVEIVNKKCDEKRIVKQSSVTSEELNDAVRSITPTDDDVLELGIEPIDSFEDELDFEPEEPASEDTGKSVYFKNLNTNFSIPKVEKADPLDSNEEEAIQSTPAKTKAKERELEKRKGGQRQGRERSRSRNRADKSSARPVRRSRSRRRKSRSLSRRRRSKSRNRSRSRNRRKSGKSPRKTSVSRKRSPSRERGRNNRRRSSRSRKRSESRTKGREPRSLSRKRSGERRRPSSKSRLEKLSRRSQSLSPERLWSKSPEIDLDHIEIEDEMSLDSLEKIKQQLMGKMCLDEDLEPVKKMEQDIEDGEITDTEDEEVQDILKKKNGVDLRKKLLRKSRPTSKTGSDKENEAKRNKQSVKGPRIQENSGIKACLKEYSADELENKLIPFKKRQFHELQFEELKIRKQIERARSKSSTPVRSVSESSASDCPQNNSTLSCSSNYPPDNLIVDIKMSPMVDMRVSPLNMKSPAVSRRVSRSNSRSEDTLSPGSRSRKVSLCEQKASSSKKELPVSPSESDRKVSPIKLSLRGVVIERPSSSSSEANVETVEVILEKVENSSQEERLQMQQDDNAVDFPTTPIKHSKHNTDVSKDLFLTDDSDFEESPVKIFKHPTSHISPFRRPEGPLDLSSPKRPPLTPKNPLKPTETDISSPQGISNMLKSPLVNHSILSPLTTTKLTSKLNFSQAVTSTPSAPISTLVTSNLKIPPTPSFLQSPKPSNLKANNPEVVKPQIKTKKKRIRLGRSVTSATEI